MERLRPSNMWLIWVLFVSCFVGVPVGSFYSWSVLIDDVKRAHPSWPSSIIPNTLSCLLVAFGFACFYGGIIQNLRLLGCIGGLLAGSGSIICAFAVSSEKSLLMFVGGIINGFGLGLAYLAFIPFVKKWFAHAPGFAAGWVMASSSSGSFVFAWLMRSLLNIYHSNTDPKRGPIDCFIIVGIITGASQVLGSLFFSVPTKVADQPGPPSPSPLKTIEIMKFPAFWILLAIFFINLTPMLGVLSIFASHIREKFPNVTENRATTYLSIINIFGTVFRLGVGVSARMLGNKNLYFVALFVGSILFLALPSALNDGTLELSLCLFIMAKICYGSSFVLTSLLCVDTLGKVNGTRVYGMSIFSLVFAALVGPTVISIDQQRHFDEYCYGCAGLLCVGCLLIVSLPKNALPEAYSKLQE